MTRGQIYLCDLEPRRGREQGAKRPVLIFSSNAYNASASPLIGIIPLTSAMPKNPLHVPLSKRETGLRMDSTALTDHLRFVDRERLEGRAAGAIAGEAMERIEANVRRLLALA